MQHFSEDRCACCAAPLSRLTETDKRFYEAMAFSFDGVCCSLPRSPWCASCRLQRRLAFRNELNLYSRNSAASGKKILSLYHEEPLWGAPYQVMLEEDWRGSYLNPFAYARDIDFTRPFFEQYADLHKAVPRMSIVNLQNENSPYTSHTGYSKNCYLLPCSEHCEDSYYGRFLQKCRNCVDCTTAHRSELCYECFQIEDCYNCAFLSLGNNCNECFFSENLVGCHHCLFCSNLRNAGYSIFNRQAAPAAFRAEVERILSSASETLLAQEKWQTLRLERLRRPANIRNCEECTGDFLLDSRNCHNCVDATDCEDCSDLITAYQAKDCRSCSNIYLDCQLDYEMLGSTQIYHCAFGFYVFRSRDVIYSEYIYDSHDLFGCAGVTRGENAILNQRYSAPEYQRLAKKLAAHMLDTGEWGETLPPHYSPFGYNETVAGDLFPLSKETAKQRGFLWRELNEKEKPVATRDLPPDKISECSDSVVGDIYRCIESGDPFKVISQELALCRKLGIALPTRSPRTRYRRREHLRFPSSFRTAQCPECGLSVHTNVPSDLTSYLRCEACYQRFFSE